MFFKGSRYEKVSESTLTDQSGRAIRYKNTRFIADTPAVSGHKVSSHERLDQITWQHFQDAERFWRICDCNFALWPDDLLEEAAILSIPDSEA
jgi:hypothetical protein